MTFDPRATFLVAALLASVSLGTVAEQPSGVDAGRRPLLSRGVGRARVIVDPTRAVPGGVLSVSVPSRRWSSASTLLDGRRGSLSPVGGALFGLVPVAIDTEPGPHTLAVFLPGGRGRGAQGSLTVDIAPASPPGRTRPFPRDDLRALEVRGLRDARALLAALRDRESPPAHVGPLRTPVEASVGFPFGGFEDFGAAVGPARDGLSGEHHRGIDYFVPPGTPVRAPGSGTVLLARVLAFSGGTIAIGHGRGLVSVLSHLGTLSVRDGDSVVEGTPVAVSAPTGWGAQGLPPHVCFATYLHSLNVDPEALLDARTFETRR